MAEQFEHLPLERQEPVTERRTRRPGFGGVKPPSNSVAHAQRLLEQFDESSGRAEEEVPGFDERLLLRLEVEGIDAGEFKAIEGLQVVSQEDRSVVVLFADETGRTEFVSRLSTLANAGKPKRQEILFAIKSFGVWRREERMGRALTLEGIPTTPEFVVDVELWPLDRLDQRTAMLNAFEGWCKAQSVTVLDRVSQITTTLVRVRLSAAILEEVLKYRDVRMVELPPRMSLPLHLHRIALSGIPPVPTPPEGAPGIVVLDSGVTTAHPFIGPAVGEAECFIEGKTSDDEHGHGTLVAGLVLYGDVRSCVDKKQFVPQLRLFSGRITDENNEGQDRLIENQVEEAVRYFVQEHGCRIFNVSVGDARRPYVGGHVGPWASILDTLARELDVLFVVSAGNFLGTAQGPVDWLGEYPSYLLSEDARLIDPAPALNVLTVGSLARYDLTPSAARNPHAVDHRPIARAGQPSPFSRSGPSIRQAIKPELVEYGGNRFVDVRAKGQPRGERELGETSTNWAFAGGNLLASESGTSFAAPKVAHLA
ncbi:S8 family peptidase [Myxococcus sp. AM001]|nr:S8 family peptidase [Myxococcus sp. AM001]